MRKFFGIKLFAVALILTTLATNSFALSRIRFAPGRSSATVAGVLGAGEVTKYVLTAREYQTMTVEVKSGNDDIRFSIADVHGLFDNYDNGYAEVETDANGNHWITLRNRGRYATRYTMTVRVR